MRRGIRSGYCDDATHPAEYGSWTVGEYPEARFLWTHRDPAAVLGSVCSLIEYCRSWVSDQDSPGIGEQQAGVWEEALRRAIAFRDRCGEERFADVRFDDLNADPVETVRSAYSAIGLTLGSSAAQRMELWAAAHRRGAQGTHEYAIEDFGLSPAAVRTRFGFYMERFKL
ncbi:MAG TPA: sulfotransferase [Acidimicrobiales bacterium]